MKLKNKVANVIRILLSEYFSCIQNGDCGRRTLVCGYNWATLTSRQMTDKEHKTCQKFAKFCKKRLSKYPFWVENEDGRLVEV